MSLRPLAAGFIAPCLPTKTDKLPSGCTRSSMTASASSPARMVDGWGRQPVAIQEFRAS